MLTLGEHGRHVLPSTSRPDFDGLKVEWDPRTSGFVLVASGEVGLFPGTLDGVPSLVAVLPKGVAHEPGETQRAGLQHFFQCWLLSMGIPIASLAHPAWSYGVDSDPRRAFPYFMAVAYAQTLRSLCQRDFRRFYLATEDTLQGRIQGRLKARQHLSLSLRGRAHEMPCAWEDFTADNWDNRILKAAMRHLLRWGARESLPLSPLFAPLANAFDGVSDVSITRTAWSLSRLGRLSSHYRQALSLARAILTGSSPSPGEAIHDTSRQSQGGTYPLRIQTHTVFERFCRRIVSTTAVGMGGAGRLKPSLDPMLDIGGGRLEPDLGIKKEGRYIALGDAKYKQVVREMADHGDLPDSAQITRLALQTSDQYQMYTYLRLESCRCGFVMVPFWERNSIPVATSKKLAFRRSPLDANGDHCLYVLGVNLMSPPHRVLIEASKRLASIIHNQQQGHRTRTTRM